MRDLRKILGTLIGIIGFIAAMAGLTYAMYTFFDSATFGNSDAPLKTCINISYEKGENVSANELDFQTTHIDSPIQTKLTFYQNADDECGTNIGTIYINTSTSTSSSLLSSGALKYTIEKQIGTNAVSETYTGYVTQTGDTEVNIGKLEEQETTYTVYLWLEKDPTGTVTNATISEAQYSGYIHTSARQGSTFVD